MNSVVNTEQSLHRGLDCAAIGAKQLVTFRLQRHDYDKTTSHQRTQVIGSSLANVAAGLLGKGSH
jgi:hypothetical protein